MKKKRSTRYFSALLALIVLLLFEGVVPGMPASDSAPLHFTVEAEAAVVYYPRCGSGYSSIVDALRSIGVDSSYSNRKKIAAINGISNYTGTASQNIQLLKLLKQGRLKKANNTNPSISMSVSSVTLDLNSSASKTITVSHVYPYCCYYSWETSGNNNYAQLRWGSWNSYGTACPLTVTGKNTGKFWLRTKLYNASSNTMVASTNWIQITVKRSSTISGGRKVFDKAYSQLGKKYGSFSGLGFHRRAWCADFVSWCAKCAGQSSAVPWNASVYYLRIAIRNAGGREYSKATIQKGGYVPQRGDIIIFKSNGASHVGIVDYKSGSTIYYIDGNNVSYGNDYNSRVNYSHCSIYYSKFTCVLKPNYR